MQDNKPLPARYDSIDHILQYVWHICSTWNFPASIEQAGNQIICLYAKLHIQPYLCSCDYAYMHRHIAGSEKDTNYKETGIRDYRLYHARPVRRGLFCKRNAVYTAVLSVVKRSGASSAESDLSAAYLTSDPSLHIISLLCCVSSGESICYEQTNAASIRCVLLCGNSGNLAVRIHWYGAGHSRYL